MSREQLERMITEAITDKSISEDRRQHLYRAHRRLWEALEEWRVAQGLERLPTPYIPNPFQIAQVTQAMGKLSPMACTGWQRR